MPENYDHFISKNIKAFYKRRLAAPIIYLIVLILAWHFFSLSAAFAPDVLPEDTALETAFRNDEQIEALGKQARLMFDDELKNTQTDADFYEKLKEDIGNYNSTKTRISSYVIQSAAKTKYSTFKDRQYASIALVYYLRQGDKLIDSPTKFTLRKDDDGHWKILFWELTEIDSDT